MFAKITTIFQFGRKNQNDNWFMTRSKSEDSYTNNVTLEGEVCQEGSSGIVNLLAYSNISATVSNGQIKLEVPGISHGETSDGLTPQQPQRKASVAVCRMEESPYRIMKVGRTGGVGASYLSRLMKLASKGAKNW